MRVRILTQYFPPEVGATQTRLHSFAEGLASRGHEVDVVCEVPNHPQGVIRPGFRRRPIVRRRAGGFSAFHVWVHTKPDKTARDRMLFYGSYAALATALSVALPRPDVILASSPPLPVAIAAACAARLRRVPWVMDVRDLWPEAAVAVGELTDPAMVRRLERLERWLYRDAAAITTVTEPFREVICGRSPAGKRIELIPNGTIPLWLESPTANPDRTALGLPTDKFVWTFAGNVGLAQGLEHAVCAAALLGNEFELVIVGAGSAKSRIEAQARQSGGRVRFVDQVPPEKAVAYARASDALLVSLAPDPVLSTFVPSKLYDFCATGRPVVVAAAGEPTRLVGEADAALPVPPGDADALADAIRRLRGDEALCENLARAGRTFAAANSRAQRTDELEALLAAVAGVSRTS